MPELPEVETIRRQLEKLIVGRTISSIEVLNPASFRADPNGLIGKTITAVGRKGKVLKIGTGAIHNLYIHLKMSGRLEFRVKGQGLKAKGELPKHLRVSFNFDSGDRLLFFDQRKFGWITDDHTVLPQGIDALDPELTPAKLTEILMSSNRPIKTVLLDQSKIAGIGNIYASEILWEAEISPLEKGRALSRQGSALIHSIRKVLSEAIEFGGSTMADGLYQHVSGEAGNYWSRRRVYDREGQPCRRCRTPIAKTIIGQRATYWCSNCQSNR